MTIAVSTNFLRPRSVEHVVDVCSVAAVSSVEIWAHDGVFAETEDLSEASARLQARQISVSSVHAPYTIDSVLRSADRQKYFERFEAACRKAQVLDADYLVVHPAVVQNEKPAADGGITDAMPESFLVWKTLAERARSRGLRVVFENLPKSTGWSDGCGVGIVRRIADELDAFEAGVCLDLSHCSANGEEPFSPAAGGVTPLVVHVSDGIVGYDRHLPLGEGDHDWDGISNELCRRRFAGPLVLEVRSPYLDGHLIGLMSEYLKVKLGRAAEKATAAPGGNRLTAAFPGD